MLSYVDLDKYPGEESFTDLDDDELREVIREAQRAADAAEEWLDAAFSELAQRSYRRMHPKPPLFERLRAAEQRRLERRRMKTKSPRRRRQR